MSRKARKMRKRAFKQRGLGRPTSATPAGPLSGPAHATTAKGKPIKILQLNIEGISASKREILHQLATTVNADIIALQETHSTKENQLGIVGFDVISSHHHRQHGMATYVKQGISAEVIGISNETDEVEWQTIKVDNLYLTNVYKPPPCAWSSPPLVHDNLTLPCIVVISIPTTRHGATPLAMRMVSAWTNGPRI